MQSEFSELKILDNFYQTSSFFPMPVVLVSTISESGATNLGPYSLMFPHIIAGSHSTMLIARESSNTAQNILRTGLCSVNFIPDDKRFMQNCVMLGYPGETTEEKMKNSIFSLQPSLRTGANVQFPDIVSEAFQVFECSLNKDYPVKSNPENQECHFLLTIDKILMPPKWKDALISGKAFPRVPVDFGYRNNSYFWFSRHRKPYAVPIPKSKGISVQTVVYAVTRFDPSVKWEDKACEKLIRVPRIFLNQAIAGIVDAAKKEGIATITPEFCDKVRDKRNAEKR